MQSLRILSRNALTNWLSLFANIIALFYLSPIIVRELGSAQYGAWVLINTITGYVGLIEAGVTISTGRFLNFHLGQRNPKQAGATISTALAFYLAIGALLFAALTVALPLIPEVNNFGPSLSHSQLSEIILILVGAIIASFLTAVFAQLLNSNNRIDLRNYIAVAGTITRFWLTIISLENDGTLVDLAKVQLVTSVTLCVATAICSSIFGSKVKIGVGTINRSAARELFGLGKWAMLNNISSKIDHQSDIVIVGSIFTPNSVAHYSVAQTLADYALTLIQNVISVATPDVTKRAGEGNTHEILRFVDQGTRFSAFFGVPTFIGVAAFGPNFIELWMGPEFLSAYYALIILAISKGSCIISQGLGIAIWATGQIRLLTTLNFIISVTSIALSIYFAKGINLGLEGVALGTCLAMLIQQFLILPIIGKRTLGIELKWFYHFIIGRFLLLTLLLSPIALLLKTFFKIDAWIDLIWVATAFTILCIPLALVVLWRPRDIVNFIQKSSTHPR